MTTCPVCGHLIDQAGAPRSRPRQTCSRSCGWILGHWLLSAGQSRVDAMAVERLVTGHPVDSTRGERLTATAILTRRGYSILDIAGLLRVTPKSISRYRFELRNQKGKAA
jgi:hypothetical protein